MLWYCTCTQFRTVLVCSCTINILQKIIIIFFVPYGTGTVQAYFILFGLIVEKIRYQLFKSIMNIRRFYVLFYYIKVPMDVTECPGSIEFIDLKYC